MKLERAHAAIMRQKVWLFVDDCCKTVTCLMLKAVQQSNDGKRRVIEAGDIMEMCLSALIDTSLCVPSFICNSVTQNVCACMINSIIASIWSRLSRVPNGSLAT